MVECSDRRLYRLSRYAELICYRLLRAVEYTPKGESDQLIDHRSTHFFLLGDEDSEVLDDESIGDIVRRFQLLRKG